MPEFSEGVIDSDSKLGKEILKYFEDNCTEKVVIVSKKDGV